MDISPLSQAPLDGAPFEDIYRFTAFTIIRLGLFTAHALIFGTGAIALLVLRPTFAALQGERWVEARGRTARRLEGFVQSSIVASAVATLTAIVLQAVLVAEAQGGEVGSDAFTATFQTPFGRWQFLRIPILVALAVLLVGRVAGHVLAGAGDDREPAGRSWWIGWLALGAALLATSTLSGHAAVASPRAVSLVNDAVHLVAGAIWFAGIVILAVVLPDAWRRGAAEDRVRVLAPSVVRFSTVAAVSVAVLAATGTLNSFLHVGAVNDLVDSGYGRALTIKIVLFGAILGLGAVNHFVIRERLRHALEGEEVDARPAAVFRRTIAAELVVGFLLMGVTGTLVGLARTRPIAVEPQDAGGVTSAPRP